MLEVLEPRNERGAMAVLEYDSSALVQAIEVLDSSNNGISCIVRVDVDSHGQTSPVLRGLGEQELKANMLGLNLLCGRQGVMR
jgi:hypothetical protein